MKRLGGFALFFGQGGVHVFVTPQGVAGLLASRLQTDS